MVRGVPVRRCDVNGNHRKVKFTTHKHTYEPTTGAEGFYGSGPLPSGVPAFAAECYVELESGYWQEPPAGAR